MLNLRLWWQAVPARPSVLFVGRFGRGPRVAGWFSGARCPGHQISRYCERRSPLADFGQYKLRITQPARRRLLIPRLYCKGYSEPTRRPQQSQGSGSVRESRGASLGNCSPTGCCLHSASREAMFAPGTIWSAMRAPTRRPSASWGSKVKHRQRVETTVDRLLKTFISRLGVIRSRAWLAVPRAR